MSLGWPAIAYPTSASAEEQSLSAAKQALDKKRQQGNPVAAIIVEPTNSSTGHIASASFIHQLHRLAHDYEAALIVDETNTGCGASGKGFWQYQGPADFVVFGKRMQVSGFFSKECPEHNFHLGDSELKLKQFAVIKNVIETQGLIEQVDKVGKALQTSVQKAVEKSQRITGVRGSGTMIWIDTKSPQEAVSLQTHLRQNGVMVKLNSMHGVVAKPALIMEDSQAQALPKALAKF